MAHRSRPAHACAVALRLAMVTLLTGVGIAVSAPAHADSIRDQQWHLNHLDIAEAHKISRGEGVTVAVLDSGVDHRHPDLKGALLEGRTFGGGRTDGWEDALGHGTAMASLIAGRGHGPGVRDGVLGIAPAAKILPVRIKSGHRGGGRGLDQGIEWAADHGADIINISQVSPPREYLEDAVDYAQAKGAVIIAGAGNTIEGSEDVGWPAAYPGVVAVSGADQDDNFSDASVSGPEVALAAPATKIMAGGSGERGRYYAGTGTSDSTAIVSGVAALIKSKHPDLDAANIINRLIATADDRGPDGRDPEYGYGIVNPVKALTADVPKVDANPLLPNAPTLTASPTHNAGAPGADAGMGPIGVILTALGVLAGLAVVVALVVAVIRRNRRTGPHP